MANEVATKKGEFTYLANGEEVRLSPNMVRKYLVSGDANAVTEQEIMMFLTLCKYQHLNPFLREAYLIKFGSTPATIVTGKDVFTKRAAKNPNYMGKDSGIVIKNEGNLEYREGTLLLAGEDLVGGWARIYAKGRQPEMYSVSFNEYAGRKRDGSLNSNWATRPATMIRKVAVVQGLRECFPEDFEGMYSPEEMSLANHAVDVNEIVGEDDAPIVVHDESTPEPTPIDLPIDESVVESHDKD